MAVLYGPLARQPELLTLAFLLVTLVDNVTVVLTNQVHVLTFRGRSGLDRSGQRGRGKEKN